MEPTTLSILILLIAAFGVTAFVWFNFQGEPGDKWRQFKAFVSDIPHKVRSRISSLFRP